MSHQHHADHIHASHVNITAVPSDHIHSKHMDMGMDHNMDHDHGSMDMDHNHGSMGMDHMMKMWFHAGYEETILFEDWKISSVGGLIGSMIGIFIMAALYEGLKYYREYLFWKTYSDLQYRAVSMPPAEKMADERQMGRPTMMSLPHVFQTGMHIVQIVLSYFLMLIFMTYNVWLCIAVVAGAATGYFLFGWKKTVIMDVTEHCH